MRSILCVFIVILIAGCQLFNDAPLDPNAPVEVLNFKMEGSAQSKLIDSSRFHNDAVAIELPYDNIIQRIPRENSGKAMMIDAKHVLGPYLYGTFIPNSESLQPGKFIIDFEIKPPENDKYKEYRILVGQIHRIHKKVKDAHLKRWSYYDIPLFLVSLVKGNIPKLSFYLKTAKGVTKREFISKKPLLANEFSSVKWFFDGKKVELSVNGVLRDSWEAKGAVVYDHPDYKPGHFVYQFASGSSLDFVLDNFKIYDLEMTKKSDQVFIKTSTDKYLNFFAQDEDKEFDIGISNFTRKEIEGVLKYNVTDHTGKEIYKDELDVDLDPLRETVSKIEIPSELRGCFWLKCEFSSKSGIRSEKETHYAVGAIRDLTAYPASSPFGEDPGDTGWHRLNSPDLGMKWTRPWLGWHNLEKKEGEWDWTLYDRIIEYNHKKGREIFVCLFGTPSWAVSSDVLKKVKEGKLEKKYLRGFPAADMNKRKEYLRKIISRYADKVDAWEVWNEANLGYWRGTPEEFMELTKVTESIVRELDPTAKIVGPSFAGSANNPFGRKTMSMGLLEKLDKLSIHYMGGWRKVAPESVLGTVNRTNDLMSKYGKVIPIWDGEFGFFTPTRNPENNRPYTATELEKLKKAGEPFLCNIHPHGNDCCEDEITTSSGYVRTILASMSKGVNKHFRHSLGNMKYETELCRGIQRKGTGVLLPAIAWTAMVERFSWAKFVKRIDLGNKKLFGLLFKDSRDGKNILACWRSAGYEDVLLNSDSDEVERYDVWGNPVSLKSMAPEQYKLKFCEMPFYLEGVGDDVSESKSFISVTPPKLLSRGKSGVLKVNVRNPLSKELNAIVKLNPSSGLELSSKKLTVKLAPGKEYSREINILAPMTMKGKSSSISVSFNSKQTGEITRFLNLAVSSAPTKCVRRKGEIKIDGEANDAAWKNLSPIELADVSQVVVGRPLYYGDPTTIRKEKEWYGPDDLSAKAYLCWDEKNLYMLLKVKDDAICVIDRKKMPFKGDCIEVFIDGRSSSKQGSRSYSKGVTQFFLTPGDKKHPTGSLLITRKNEKNQKWPIELASKNVKDGYVIEVKIPITKGIFPELQMKEGALLGFDLSIDDADSGKRKSQTVWRGTKNNYSDASQFGKLILKK